MISNWLSAALARRNIHYGWVMVGVTFLTALITAGTVGEPGVPVAPYAVSKAGVVQMTKALALEWARYGKRFSEARMTIQ